ncbi:Endoglucanase 9 [Sesamum angolense]|uniref:Endoglucanase n=1 Tax=Sesamum angolense TaxID=2727404 RepID=A0AAE1WCU5_9LAMI|nr:Endoglucanase 9 [Sesamum angolense]
MSETSESEMHPVRFAHTVSGAGRLLPSASRWNSIELDFNLHPGTSDGYDSLPSRFSKSIDFNLTISDKTFFRRCVYVLIFVVVLVPVMVLLVHFMTHKKEIDEKSKDLMLALSRALLFFDAQKSGHLRQNSTINFRGNSAYTVTLLSWTVVEYQQKYADAGELDHIKDIIKWGSDYLLKLFIPPNSSSDSAILYSQVGGSGNGTNQENDLSCWQRPEDMSYPRPVSICDDTATDLVGEIVAGMSAASLVFSGNKEYSRKLVQTAVDLFNLATRQDPSHTPGIYTENDACGGQARDFYKSSSYIDELVWGGTWLFFATGNSTYLKYATDNFAAAEEEELLSDKGIFYWNNKLTANAILLTRIRYFIDLGYPYEDSLSTNRTACSCVRGLVLLKPNAGAPLHSAVFSVETLQAFAMSQVYYILGDNPMKISYMVGYGDRYPTHVHHRGSSIPWDRKQHSCSEGSAYLNSKGENPNKLVGAMVGGPENNDVFLDGRDKPLFTEPSISSNAGLVAALIALLDPPNNSADSDSAHLGIDKMGIFKNVHLT